MKKMIVSVVALMLSMCCIACGVGNVNSVSEGKVIKLTLDNVEDYLDVSGYKSDAWADTDPLKDGLMQWEENIEVYPALGIGDCEFKNVTVNVRITRTISKSIIESRLLTGENYYRISVNAEGEGAETDYVSYFVVGKCSPSDVKVTYEITDVSGEVIEYQ